MSTKKFGRKEAWMLVAYCMSTAVLFLSPEAIVWRRVVLVAALSVVTVAGVMLVRRREAGCAGE